MEDVLALSVGSAPEQGRIVKLRQGEVWHKTPLLVAPGDVLLVRVTGRIRVGYMTVTPQGPEYAERWEGVEVKVGTQILRVKDGKGRMRVRDGGRVFLRLDLSSYSWFAPESVEGAFRVSLRLVGRGMVYEPQREVQRRVSAADALQRLLEEQDETPPPPPEPSVEEDEEGK